LRNFTLQNYKLDIKNQIKKAKKKVLPKDKKVKKNSVNPFGVLA